VPTQRTQSPTPPPTGRGIPFIAEAAVVEAVAPELAVEVTRRAFERYAAGEWTMPPKVYLESPPGDFRAMPARGEGIAILKWVTSFPDNPKRGLPVVTGLILVSDAQTGEELAVVDCRSVTSLRTGAAAAVSTLALAPAGARGVGLIGCGVNGAWAGRCLRAAGFERGVCHDADPAAASALAAELGWSAAGREEAASQDVVVTVTPGNAPVVLDSDLRPGQHLVALGADAPGKSEIELAALGRCRLFCDDWKQASGGGELTEAVARGLVAEADVVPLGAVLAEPGRGRRGEDEITLFDSTGLAIQDLGIVLAVLEAWRAGEIDAPIVDPRGRGG